MPNIRAEFEIPSGDLAWQISRDDDLMRDNYSGLLNFVIEIDEYVCDLEFTVALRDKLNAIIEREAE